MTPLESTPPGSDPLEKRASPASTPRARRALGGLLALALAALVATLVFPERLYPARTLDLRADAVLATTSVASSSLASRVHATFARTTLFRVPRSARVLEDGRALERVWCEPAALGSGRWTGQGPALAFASTDGSAPLANGRRYELVLEPDTVLALLSLRGVLLLITTGVLFLLAARAGAIALTGPSPPRTRAALVLALVLALGAGAAKSWDLLAVNPDTDGYLEGSPLRPPLYPAFVNLFDRESGPRPPLAATDELRPEPGSRYAGVVHAQRALAVVALATLAFVLTRTLNAWLVGGLFFLGALLDTERVGGSSSLAFHAGSLMSEGINGPLVFFLLAATFEFLHRPGWSRGILVSGCLALLFLTRSANVGLVTVLPLLWAVQRMTGETPAPLSADPLSPAPLGWPRAGWRTASGRTAVLALVFCAPLLVACEANRERHGRFRLHAFTGPSLFGLALGTATPEDAAALEDPALRRFLEACLADPRRPAGPAANGDDLNANVYRVGYPAAARTLPSAPGEELWVADDAFQAVSRSLFRRHPGATLALVLAHVARFLEPLHGLDLVAFALSLWLWRRTRAPELLFAASFALLPFVYMLPICVFNFPSERYRSQVSFAEWLALPFLGVVLLSLGRVAPGPSASPAEPSVRAE